MNRQISLYIPGSLLYKFLFCLPLFQSGVFCKAYLNEPRNSNGEKFVLFLNNLLKDCG